MSAFLNSVYGAGLLSITILLFLFIYKIRTRSHSTQYPIVSQAMLHHRFFDSKKYSRKLKTKTQSKKHQEEANVKVIIVGNQAYWIKNNTFYKAPLVDQLIDKDSAERVDTTNMDKVQLDQMLFIVDKLTEGASDDSRGSRDA